MSYRRHSQALKTSRVPSGSATIFILGTSEMNAPHGPKTSRTLLIAGVAVSSVSLQGCSVEVPRHMIGYWQTQESYLETYKADLPGPGPSALNPCSVESPRYLQCGGHGECRPWLADPNVDNATEVASALKFCQCEEAWADPNCETPRKSQQLAFLISMFGGFFGLDQLYLGFFFPYGLFKLLTLGGLGVWWVYDLVRIGSSPVGTAASFKVMNNVPHWAFVLSATALFVALAFVYSAWSIQRHRVQKQREVTEGHGR